MVWKIDEGRCKEANLEAVEIIQAGDDDGLDQGDKAGEQQMGSHWLSADPSHPNIAVSPTELGPQQTRNSGLLLG